MMIFGLLLLHVSCTTAVNIGFAQKKGGKTGIVLTSSKFKKRYFKVEDNLLGYYKKEASKKPQKPGLPTQAGIYYTTDPSHVTGNELIMWSAGLESMAFTDIIAKPQRIGNDDWIQHLKFDDTDSLEQWIAKLSQVCTVNETNSEDWAAIQEEALARGWTMEIGVALKKGSSNKKNWKPRTFKLYKDSRTAQISLDYYRRPDFFLREWFHDGIGWGPFGSTHEYGEYTRVQRIYSSPKVIPASAGGGVVWDMTGKEDRRIRNEHLKDQLPIRDHDDVLELRGQLSIEEGGTIFITKDYVNRNNFMKDYVKINDHVKYYTRHYHLVVWSGEHGGKSTREIYDAAPISTPGVTSWSQILDFHSPEARSAWINNLKETCKKSEIGFQELTPVADLMHMKRHRDELKLAVSKRT